MPAGEKHELAVKKIEAAIEIEFGVKRYGQSLNFGTCIPDIAFKCRNRKKEMFIVVEVGSTSAEKIKKYIESGFVAEIRWYDKDCNLVWVWFNKNKRMPYRRKTKAAEMLAEILEQREKLPHRKKLEAGNILALCPGCFSRFNVDLGKTVVWIPGQKEILICGKYESTFSATDIEEALCYLESRRFQSNASSNPFASTIKSE